MSGCLYIISGPSGVGKSTLVRQLRNRVPELGYSISHTSRLPRVNEENGVHYHFVDNDTFQKMINENAFVEWAKVYDEFYGTSFSGLHTQFDQGLDVILDIDSQGAKSIQTRFAESVLIYILPPSLDILKERLTVRALDDKETIVTRFEEATKELRNCMWYHYIIVNNDLEKAVKELESIILCHRCRTFRMLPKIKGMLGDMEESHRRQ